MTDLNVAQAPVAQAAMLIRRPVAEVFEAFVAPIITTQFWFTKSSGRLEQGKQIQWEWGMYDFSMEVKVVVLERDKRILIEWPAPGGPTLVEWTFFPHTDNTTFVSITNAGFTGDDDEKVRQAINSTEGFALVLAGLKALLEHHIVLNLVPDRFPKGLGKH